MAATGRAGGDRMSTTPGGWPWLPWTAAAVAVGAAVGLLVGRSQVVPTAAPWPSYAEVYAAVAPVVVNVAVGGPDPRVGSGFALSDEHVVTARHLVVDTGGSLTVRTVDGRDLQARVVGTDARTDLAILECPDAALKPATLGRSSDLAVGDSVLALGNPYGLGHTLAVGVLGSRGRLLGGDDGDGPRVEFLQLTIPLNPGNSGGPIVDAGGRVVGVLTGTHAQGQAIAFAVPVEALRDVLPLLMEGARVSEAFLGVRTVTAASGVRVVSVASSGPAGQAGIRPGDVLTQVAGRAVTTPGELTAILDDLPVTSHVFVMLVRDGDTIAVDVGLEDRAEQPLVVAGMILRPEAGAGGAVTAVRPRSRAENAGVRVGDVLRTVDGVPVQSPADVHEILADGRAATLEVLRSGEPLILVMEAASEG